MNPLEFTTQVALPLFSVVLKLMADAGSTGNTIDTTKTAIRGRARIGLRFIATA
jgi:hypothetical protein